MPHPSRPTGRSWRSRHRVGVATAIALLVPSIGVTAPVAAPPAGAQARLVNALVRTVPERPEPGEDVAVIVSVTGCPRGKVTVEIYLTTSDGATQSAALMTRTAATTTLLLRTRATLSLPDALEGWYGARVLCGTFRPPKQAMANTLFAVGAKPTKESNLAGSSVVLGGTLRFSGNGCPGTTVEYDISGGARWPGPFDADGTIPVAADGTWSIDLPFLDDEVGPGPAGVRARCVITDSSGEDLHVYYGGTTEVTVERAPEPTIAPEG